jgi:glutamate--cysteine ligase catalytic subunit
MSDFENAALVVFTALITRVIITFGLDLAIPISQVNENMKRTHHRDSARQEKFFFRCGTEVHEMFMNEIINGTNDFLGLVPLARQYIHEREDIDADTRHTIEQYLLLISKRAAGDFCSFVFMINLVIFLKELY